MTRPTPVVAAESSNPLWELREKVVSGTGQDFGFAPSDRLPNVWAALFEWGMDGAVATTACYADGTTSLYVSSGGGLIGAGKDQAGLQANRAFLDECERALPFLEATDSPPLPEPGTVRFNVLTYSGARTGSGVPDELVPGNLPLTPLFRAGNDVLTIIRLAYPR